MAADGVCYWCPRHNYWGGTFVDAVHTKAIMECLEKAQEMADEGLPANGEVRIVEFHQAQGKEAMAYGHPER